MGFKWIKWDYRWIKMDCYWIMMIMDQWDSRWFLNQWDFSWNVRMPTINLPSGKRLHNYGKIHNCSWENPLFLWPCSIANC